MTWVRAKRISVFTQTPYEGNPAWVIIGVDPGTSEKKLIRLASELNPLSDTTFVFLGDRDSDIYLRFFSQSSEIKFSGHGTIATYFALGDEKLIKFNEPITIVKQKTKAGIHTVEIRVSNKKITRTTVCLPPPHKLSLDLDIKAISRFLGISPVDILNTGYPVKAVESEYVEIIVPLKYLNMLLETNPNFPLMKNYCERMGITGIIVFTSETIKKNSTVHMRHFAPAVGINEDPTSGGAAVDLGYYLLENGIVPYEEITRVVVEQGYAQKRPGVVYVHLHTYKNEVLSASFGGQAVCTFEGRIIFP